jgi:hypothetical protein
MQERSKERKYCKFVQDLHQAADLPRKKAEERAKNPIFRGKPKDTTRRSSIEFFQKWQG